MALNNLSKDLNYLFDKTSGPKILWSGSKWMTKDTTISLSENISKQTSGIVLVFSRGTNSFNESEYEDSYWHTFFVPKSIINIDNGGATSFVLFRESDINVKKVYINSASIKGHATNDNQLYSLMGKMVNNRHFVLRYVYGV